MTNAQHIALASRPKGSPTLENFRLEALTLKDPAAGEVLVRTLYMSLDPYMRGRMDDAASYADPVALGQTMEGGGVGQVIATASDRFKVGDIVVGRTGWASHAILSDSEIRIVDPNLAPVSTALGVLGMPGQTAFVGVNDNLQGKAGETLVVSAATGAVGSLAGQLGKRIGMRTVGVAGGAEKCAYAVEHLGYDVCLDHRSETLKEDLAAATPDGIDCYFENVAGATLEAVLPNMNVHGRIAVCGMIAWYSGQGLGDAMPLPKMWRSILVNRLKVQGFIIFDHNDRLKPFLKEVGPLVASGDIHFKESVSEGLENAPQAFLDLLKGGNFGKQIVHLADPE